MIYQLDNDCPDIHETTYVAPSAQVMGNVTCHEQSSIWFNAVLRGDCDNISVGPQSNIQDGSILHTDHGFPLIIGTGVTVGHKVMLHGCEIGDYSLIGINAVVLNGAKIGKYCIIGANALVTENMEIPDNSVVMGSPGKIVKSVPEAAQEQLRTSAQHYVQNAARFQAGLKPL